MFCIFPAHGKIGTKWPQMGPGVFFSTKRDLANILGRTDLDFDNDLISSYCNQKEKGTICQMSMFFTVCKPPLSKEDLELFLRHLALSCLVMTNDV